MDCSKKSIGRQETFVLDSFEQAMFVPRGVVSSFYKSKMEGRGGGGGRICRSVLL